VDLLAAALVEQPGGPQQAGLSRGRGNHCEQGNQFPQDTPAPGRN
jgi:hypothetical protein